MATEKRLIDEFRSELMSKFIDLCRGNDYNKLTLLRIGETIDRIYEKYSLLPTVDAVEVVRCKDCKHYMAEEKERCEAMKATPYGLCIKHRGLPLASYHEYRNEDGFCSYGERKDNESNCNN